MSASAVDSTTGPDWSKADVWGPPRPARPLGPTDLGIGVILFVLAQVVALLLGLWQVGTGQVSSVEELTSSPVVLIGGLLLLWSAFLGTPLLVARRTRRRLREVIVLPKVTGMALLGGIGLGLVLRGGSLLTGWAAQKMGMPVGENTSWLSSVTSLPVLIALLVGTALVGPIMEEVFFRGLALRALSTKGRTGLALLVSSALFGVSHFTSADGAGLFVIIQTGLLGAVFGWFALRRGLVIPIAAHVAFNTSGVILLMMGMG